MPFASESQKARVVVGLYDAAFKNDPNIKTERLYLVFFLDDDNNPLHTLPLKYAARGVNGATFEIERKAFRAELEACHAITNHASAKPKNEQFHSLGVFCFTTKAELVGDKMKHWCCRVVEHEKPTTENWKSYFVGYTHLKEQTWSALEPMQKMDVFSTGPALAAGEDMAGLPDRVTPPDFVVEPQTASGLRLAEPRGSTTVTINRHDEERYGSSSQGPDLPF